MSDDPMRALFVPMPVEAHPTIHNVCYGKDEDGVTWEFWYIVPLREREKLMYRQQGLQTWQDLPIWALPPVEVMEFFHGELVQGEPSDDSKALDYLAAVLCENEWNGDTADRIADIVRSTGRAVEDSPESPS